MFTQATYEFVYAMGFVIYCYCPVKFALLDF